jgi:hypothetical protein
MSFFDTVSGVLKHGIDFLDALVKYAAALRPFVVQTARELEALIPDNGLGSVKLMAFDEALKVFVAASDKFSGVDASQGGAVWTLAHWLLESFLAAEKVIKNPSPAPIVSAG